MINWAEVRAKFPVASGSVYLNTAAAGPLAESTARAGAEYYKQMMNDGDIHWDAWLARREEVRAQVAAFINAEPEEIAPTHAVLQAVADGTRKFTREEREWCVTEAMVLTGFTRTPVQLIEAGEPALARILLEGDVNRS